MGLLTTHTQLINSYRNPRHQMGKNPQDHLARGHWLRDEQAEAQEEGRGLCRFSWLVGAQWGQTRSLLVPTPSILSPASVIRVPCLTVYKGAQQHESLHIHSKIQFHYVINLANLKYNHHNKHEHVHEAYGALPSSLDVLGDDFWMAHARLKKTPRSKDTSPCPRGREQIFLLPSICALYKAKP